MNDIEIILTLHAIILFSLASTNTNSGQPPPLKANDISSTQEMPYNANNLSDPSDPNPYKLGTIIPVFLYDNESCSLWFCKQDKECDEEMNGTVKCPCKCGFYINQKNRCQQIPYEELTMLLLGFKFPIQIPPPAPDISSRSSYLHTFVQFFGGIFGGPTGWIGYYSRSVRFRGIQYVCN